MRTWSVTSAGRRSDMDRPRALLTGRNGFTGHYVAAELEAAGYEVVGLGERQGPAGNRSITANLLDRAAVRAAVAAVEPDVVLHLAAISFVAHDDVDEIYRVNVMGTRNLLGALSELVRKPQIVVLASSANIYGNADVDPITEDTPPAPANDYAVSKLAMEYMARLWMDKLPIVITRPFNYTGVGQSEQFLIPKIVSHFRRRADVIELGNTEVERDFGDVRDVARVYRNILETKPVGRVINICTGIGVSISGIISILENLTNHHIVARTNQAYVRANDIIRLVGSNSQLISIMGDSRWMGMEKTLAWMLKETSSP